jgi:ABC-type phosphate transport system substrate-binding protein
MCPAPGSPSPAEIRSCKPVRAPEGSRAGSRGMPGAPTLTGVGSTFDAPFFSVAFARNQQQHPGVTICYSAAASQIRGLSRRPATPMAAASWARP